MWRRLLRIRPPLSKLFLIWSGTYLSIFHPYKCKIRKITSLRNSCNFLVENLCKRKICEIRLTVFYLYPLLHCFYLSNQGVLKGQNYEEVEFPKKFHLNVSCWACSWGLSDHWLCGHCFTECCNSIDLISQFSQIFSNPTSIRDVWKLFSKCWLIMLFDRININS